MIVIGLTGSIAMGKSTASSMLAAMDGVAVLCSDDIVRGLYGQRAVIDLIRARFPATYDVRCGQIDKTRLLAELGTDPEKWTALEEILHPLVLAAQQKFLREQQALGTRFAVLDIPLLFETGGEQRVNYTIVVTAPAFIHEQRIARRIAEGRLTEEDYRFRLSRQMPDAEKQRRADFVVQSGQGLDFTRQALEAIIRDLKEKHFSNGHERRDLPPLKL